VRKANRKKSGQSGEDDASEGNDNPTWRTALRPFIVPHQSPMLNQPGERPLLNPASRQHSESWDSVGTSGVSRTAACGGSSSASSSTSAHDDSGKARTRRHFISWHLDAESGQLDRTSTLRQNMQMFGWCWSLEWVWVGVGGIIKRPGVWRSAFIQNPVRPILLHSIGI
jgi:hypothetical protein